MNSCIRTAVRPRPVALQGAPDLSPKPGQVRSSETAAHEVLLGEDPPVALSKRAASALVQIRGECAETVHPATCHGG